MKSRELLYDMQDLICFYPIHTPCKRLKRIYEIIGKIVSFKICVFSMTVV